MEVTLSSDLQLRLARIAARRGRDLETMAREAIECFVDLNVAEQLAPSSPIATLQETDPEEWARQFRAWAENHDPGLPVLSDEAMSRESIYPDRT